MRSTVEEDRTDRARGSRGSFRLSNLVEARMAEQHSSSSVVPSNVAAVHAAAPAPAADATLVRLTIQTTSVPEANTRPSTQRQIQIQLNPDQRLLPLLHGLQNPLWRKSPLAGPRPCRCRSCIPLLHSLFQAQEGHTWVLLEHLVGLLLTRCQRSCSCRENHCTYRCQS